MSRRCQKPVQNQLYIICNTLKKFTGFRFQSVPQLSRIVFKLTNWYLDSVCKLKEGKGIYMETTSLKESTQEVNEKTQENTLPYFIVIEKSDNKKFKLPCANKKIADKVQATYSMLIKKR